MEKHLNIVSLTVPYPPDYGGVYDLYYKLQALQNQGVHIHLHCFDYGRGEQPILQQYCKSVTYYKRNTGHKGISFKYPYIVASRYSEALITNLNSNNYPILLEGTHCTLPIFHPSLKNRKFFVRLHNVEHVYYRALAKHASHLGKKIYYWRESKMLKKHEKAIADKATFWGVSPKDCTLFKQTTNCTNIDYLPVFLPNWTMNVQEGLGSYCLFHGDLSVDENYYTAMWLLNNVFHQLELPFVIAGKNPSKKLMQLAKQRNHTCMVANPSEKEMQDLIKRAHINLVPSNNHTGIKIKLLNALFNGRHCVVNKAAIEGTGLAEACYMANTAAEMQHTISQLYHQPFTPEEMIIRKKILGDIFDNAKNAQQMIRWIWG